MTTRTTYPLDAGRLRRRRQERALAMMRLAIALVVALIVIFPLYWMLAVALSTRAELLGGDQRLWPRTVTMENFDQVLSAFPVGTWFTNSVAIALVTAAITVAVSLLAGFAFAHLRFRGSSVLLLIALSTLMLPVRVIMVALFRLVTDLGLYGSYWAVVLPTAATAFGVFLARQFLLTIPGDLIEAARIDAAGDFVRIVLPLSKSLAILRAGFHPERPPLICHRQGAMVIFCHAHHHGPCWSPGCPKGTARPVGPPLGGRR